MSFLRETTQRPRQRANVQNNDFVRTVHVSDLLMAEEALSASDALTGECHQNNKWEIISYA